MQYGIGEWKFWNNLARIPNHYFREIHRQFFSPIFAKNLIKIEFCVLIWAPLESN